MWHFGDRWYGVHEYVFLNRIHQGFTAEVWAAYSLADRQLYAIKVLCRPLLERIPAVIFAPDSDDNEMISEWDRSLKEIQILARLKDCPHVVNVKEVINLPPAESAAADTDPKASHVTFVIMEYLPQRLAEHVDGPLYDRRLKSEADFWLVAKELLLLLQELRDHNICHKDLKPENLLFTRPVETEQPDKTLSGRNGTIYECTKDMAGHPFLLLEQSLEPCPAEIGDFSLDISQGSNRIPTPLHIKCVDFNVSSETLQICDSEGTNAFTPPEAFYKVTPLFDGVKRDLWSLGVTLLLLITQKLPFFAPVPIRLQLMIIAGDVEWENCTGFSKGIDFCKRLLAKDPETRISLPEAIALVEQEVTSLSKTLEDLRFVS